MTARPDTSIPVVVCTYTDRRWAEVSAGLRGGQSRLIPGDGLLSGADQQEEGQNRGGGESHGRGDGGARGAGNSRGT